MSVLELSPAKLSQSADDGAMFHPTPTYCQKLCATSHAGTNESAPNCTSSKKQTVVKQGALSAFRE